jgi:SNF2 family DNA or RNA helicase
LCVLSTRCLHSQLNILEQHNTMKNNQSNTPKAEVKKAKTKKKKPEKLNPNKRPDKISTDSWQYGLRKQFGEDATFRVVNTTTEPIFSTFDLTNPDTRNSYTVAVRCGLTTFEKLQPNTITRRGNGCSCLDFSTNRLGICKHIAAVVAHISKKSGVKTKLKHPPRTSHTAIYLDYFHGRKLRICIGTANEKKMQTWAAKYFDHDGFLLSDQLTNFNQIHTEGKEISKSFVCEQPALDYVVRQRDQLTVQKKMQKLLGKSVETAIDGLIKIKPYPYQLEGIAFAASHSRTLIADEMGLGKTLQAIGAAELYKKHLGVGKVLVVCPTSLKYQWQMEVTKFCHSTAEVLEGNALLRKKRYTESEAFYHIVSYNTVVYDIDEICAAGYDLIIFDEAQRMKNFRTKVATAVKRITTPYVIVLTGTPIENKLEELYSLVQIIDQYKMPPLYRYTERYQMQNETGKVIGYKNLHEIGKILSDTLIRRTKKQVLTQMPDRVDKVLFVPMTKQQRDVHAESENQVAQLVLKWQKFHFLTETDRQKLLQHLSIMRMVCDSTYVVDQKTRYDTKIDELFSILEEALTNPELKVVIFSQWERMTRLVVQEAQERGIGCSYLHGGIPSKLRGGLIEQFHKDEECKLFISTDAGATGLNLQCASLLINLDLPWNPGLLEQRIGRIYRLGQRNNITVINMVSQNTIENRILYLLDFKRDMAKGVLDSDGEDTIFMSEERLKKFMEQIQDLTIPSITKTNELDEALLASNQTSAPEEDLEKQLEDSDAPNIGQASDSETTTPASSVIRRGRRPKLPDTFEGDDDVQTDESAPTPEPQDRTIKPQAGGIMYLEEQAAQQGSGSSQQTNVAQEGSRSDKTTRDQHGDFDDSKRQNNGVRSTQRPTSLSDSPQELVSAGISFLSGLGETLASREKTEALVASITETDVQTGQTYLKIPVQDQAVVQNAIQLIGNLFAAFGK